MLRKLLKYDLKYMFKNMIVFYILALVFSVLTRIIFSLKQTNIVYIMGQISVGFMFSILGSILFNTIIRSWVRFNDSMYKDESYLTHTLPVTKKQIYNSRFLQSLLFSIVSFLIIVLSIFITYYTKERWLLVKSTINSISIGLNINTAFAVTSIIIIFFLEIFNIIQCGFLGLIMGNRSNNNKTIFSVIFGFIIYTLSQFFVLMMLFIIGLFNSNIKSIFITNNVMDNTTMKLLIFLSIIIYTFIIAIMNIICSKNLEKGVNV